MQNERDSKPWAKKRPDLGKWPGVGPTTKNLRLTQNRCSLLTGLYCSSSSCSARTVSTLDNAMLCHRISGGQGVMVGRRREGTCDRGQVRVGTCFALNEDEASYLSAIRRRVWTYMCP